MGDVAPLNGSVTGVGPDGVFGPARLPGVMPREGLTSAWCVARAVKSAALDAPTPATHAKVRALKMA